MKKILFDLDNTLILNREEYIDYYAEALKDLGYESNKEKAMTIYKGIGEYEKVTLMYNKETLTDFLNEYMDEEYDVEIIDRLNYYIGKYWIEKSKEKEEVLKYLSKKYDLYVLTNWFTEVQTERLRNSDILKYFKEVVGGDKVIIKPNPDGYLYFTDDCEIEDCIMIGDSLATDYEGAKRLGMPVLLYDYKDIYSRDEYELIKDFKELMEIL